MTDVYEQAYSLARAWIDDLPNVPAGAPSTLGELRDLFEATLPETGELPEEIIPDLAHRARGGLNANASGRFFGWVMGGSVPSALAADWLVSAWDQNAAIYAVSPIGAVIEEVAGAWVKDLFDLPRDASFAFTTGCQLAHVTALASARHAVLKRAGWDVEEDGVFGAPAIRLISTHNRHDSIDRAARFLGLGRASIAVVETDALGRMDADALRRVLADTSGPTIVSLNAADLNIGAFDNFETLIPIAKAAGAWVHIDGAFGLFARVSRAKAHLVKGIEQADSWSTDGHKWLNVPFDCGIVIIRDSHAHRGAMAQSADYIDLDTGGRNQLDWNLEWSRRARAIPVYAALREMGRSGVEALIDRCCAYCSTLVERIGALPGAEIVVAPELNQGLVRFTRDGASDEENATFTDEVVAAINDTGEAFFSPTIWNGIRAMRISVVNWQTNDSDVDRAVAAARSVLEELRRA